MTTLDYGDFLFAMQTNAALGLSDALRANAEKLMAMRGRRQSRCRKRGKRIDYPAMRRLASMTECAKERQISPRIVSDVGCSLIVIL